MTNSKKEAILEVGREGGDYTIFGERHEGCWRFWREPGCCDSWLYSIDEVSAQVPADEFREPEIHYLYTLDDALGTINQCWPRLLPLKVHPEFASEIGIRVLRYLSEEQLSKDSSVYGRVIERWSEFCPVDQSVIESPGFGRRFVAGYRPEDR